MWCRGTATAHPEVEGAPSPDETGQVQTDNFRTPKNWLEKTTAGGEVGLVVKFAVSYSIFGEISIFCKSSTPYLSISKYC